MIKVIQLIKNSKIFILEMVLSTITFKVFSGEFIKNVRKISVD